MKRVQHIRTTRANLDSQKTASGLLEGEVYLITDEGKIAIGTATNNYEVYAKDSALSGKQDRYKKTTSAMSGTTLTVTDSDITADSYIAWIASAATNGYIQTTVTAGQVVFTSTASETVSFTYYILK